MSRDQCQFYSIISDYRLSTLNLTVKMLSIESGPKDLYLCISMSTQDDTDPARDMILEMNESALNTFSVPIASNDRNGQEKLL